MKILITGSAGMLGTDLVEVLRPQFELVGIDRRDVPEAKIPMHGIDLVNAEATRACLLKERPALIFHTAAKTHVDSCESERQDALNLNVEVTRNLVRAGNEVGARLIFFSTDYVFDGTKKGEYTEDDATCPLNFYGETKCLAEKAIQTEARKFNIFRVSWLYGLHGRSFPRTILQKAKGVGLLKVVSDQIGRPTFTRDVAQAFLEMLTRQSSAFERAEHQIFNLANDGTCSWAEMASAVLKYAGFDQVKVECVDSTQYPLPAARPKNSVLSTAKIQQHLGIRLRPWQEAARDFVKELA